ncbi:YcaO-like family protein [Mesobacillus thioparans]|uniref:YcaO-like family protein n=1 Tax=Mesobacillus thioparans TaxID=370439 RepID=UPI0039EE2251
MNFKTDYNAVVDPRVGIITSLNKTTYCNRLPKKAVSWNASVSNGSILNGMQSDRIAGGTHFDSDKAKYAAIGEAIERYSGNYIQRNLIKGSYNSLKRKGYTLLDPMQIPLYSHMQYKQKGFPFIPMTRDLPIEWVEGYSLTQRQNVWIPASLVFINYYNKDRIKTEPLTNFVIFSGVACGNTIESSITSGLLELIERDATAMWWAWQPHLNALDINSHEQIKRLLETEEEDTGISYKVIPLNTDINTPVTGALMIDSQLDLKLMGFSARHSPVESVLKSLAETFQLHNVASSLLDPFSQTWLAAEDGILNDKALTHYRRDRSYKKSFRDDFRDMGDLFHNLQYYLDISTHEKLNFITNAKEVNSSFFEGNYNRGFDEILKNLNDLDLECLYVDITTSDIKEVGLHVTRTLVPGLIPNAPTAFPFLGPDRLYKVPKKLGWETNKEINLYPLPHS